MGARFAAIALSLAVGIGPCLARADEVARSDVPESAKPSAKLSASLGISPLRLGGIAVGGLGATGLLTGTFDEVTGDAEIPDFRHPEFKLKVKLLQVY